MKILLEQIPQLQELKNKDLFEKVKVDAGGYGVSWNDNLDLEAETIWQYGTNVGCASLGAIKELAARLTDARNSIGMTQKQLAEKTGIYQADISKIERGLSNPSVETLERLATGMGLKLRISFDSKKEF